MSLQPILLVAGTALTAGTLYGLRREHIRAEYSVSWLAAGAVLFVAGLVPGGMKAVWAEIQLDQRLYFLIAAGLVFANLVFWVTRLVSRLWDEKVMLAQQAAILEFRMRQETDVQGRSAKTFTATG